jgi:hypothetical protein
MTDAKLSRPSSRSPSPSGAPNELNRELTVEGLPYPEQAGQTHWEGCWRVAGHHNCAVALLAEQRELIGRLTRQRDAALFNNDLERSARERAQSEVSRLSGEVERLTEACREKDEGNVALAFRLKEAWRERDEARGAADRMREKAEAYDRINSPELYDFVSAVTNEALHQREKWGIDADGGKSDADWFWLIGYLAGKALHNPEKSDMPPTDARLHRIITVAAAAANWHAATLGTYARMRPGIESPDGASRSAGAGTTTQERDHE